MISSVTERSIDKLKIGFSPSKKMFSFATMIALQK